MGSMYVRSGQLCVCVFLFSCPAPAKVQSVRLHRMKQSISAETCVALGSLTDKDSRGHVIQSTAWMITDKNYSLAMLTKLQVIPVSDCRQDLIEAAAMCNPPGTQVDFILLPAKPLCTIPSTDWFSAIVYEKLVADEKREVVSWILDGMD